MKEYSTKQKESIKDLLKNQNHRFTTDEILLSLNSGNSHVSKATLYRQLKELVEEGSVKTFYNENLKRYEYQALEVTPECKDHIHLRCSKCGKVIHLDCKQEKKFLEHVKKKHGFEIDVENTFISGICSDCAKEKK
ncbi:MAG: transcriptional repressor [Bacilli bacterium]|jgi:Fur family transcriptional regulator, ferric uptake regulator